VVLSSAARERLAISSVVHCTDFLTIVAWMKTGGMEPMPVAGRVRK